MDFDILKQLFSRAGGPCSASSLPWFWLVEILATMKEVDASRLVDFVKNIPEISERQGQNLRELVALKILENLFEERIQFQVGGSSQDQKIIFDPSERCEDAYRSILNEIFASDLEMTETETSKLDLRPFIMHKKSCLPECTLLRLKNVILKGSNSHLAFLKEKSGLATGNQSDNRIIVDAVETSDVEQKPMNGAEDSTSVIRHENLLCTNRSPTKRFRNVSHLENLEVEPDDNGMIMDNGRVANSNITKKLKQDAPCNRQATDGTSVSVCGTESVEYVPKRNLQLSIGALEEFTSHGDGRSKDVEPVMLVQTLDLADIESPNNQRQMSCHEDEMQKNESVCDKSKNVYVDEKKENTEVVEVEFLGECQTDGDGHVKDGVAMIRGQSGDLDETEFLCNQWQMPSNDNETQDNLSGDGQGKNVCVDENKGDRNGIRVRASKDYSFSGDGLDKDEASSMPGQSDDLIDTELLPTRQCISSTDYEIQDDGFGADQGKTVCVNENREDTEDIDGMKMMDSTSQCTNKKIASVEEVKEKCHERFQPNISMVELPDQVKDDMEHDGIQGISSDSDDYHDDRVDVATKKHTFLKSKFTCHQDLLEKSKCSELIICMKCNEGGKLLVCSVNSCPLVFHEECLGSAVSFNGEGNFYCPFCAYSEAISELFELKKKASLARKDLAVFMGRSGQRKGRQEAELIDNNGSDMKGECVNNVDGDQCLENADDQLHSEALVVLGKDDNIPTGKKGTAVTNKMHYISIEDRWEEERIGCECQTWRDLKKPHIVVGEIPDRGINNSATSDTEIDNGNESPSNIEQLHGVGHQQIAVSPVKDARSPISVELVSESENEESIVSKYFVQFRKQDLSIAYPAVPQQRRKKLPWTEEEESTLKEGVERFFSPRDKNIPWKQILEFGGQVFQNGRTTIDLKDKWRNMGRSPKSK